LFELKNLPVYCFLTFSIFLVISNAFCYNLSPFIARFLLIATFSILVVATIVINITLINYPRLKAFSIILMLSSFFFLIWRSSLFAPNFIEWGLNSETIFLCQQYDTNHYLVFDSVHSFFFLQPLVLHTLCIIGGFSVISCIYTSLLICGTLSGLIGILVYKTLSQYLRTNNNEKSINLFFSLIAFLMISFAFSERSMKATNFSLTLTLMTLWFLVAKKFRNRRENLILLLFITGITIGDTNGILLLVPLFFLYAVFAKKRTVIIYALIPIYYLMFSAYSYILRLQKYATFAINGFVEFFGEIISGHLPERIIPWRRTISCNYEDAVISSVAYLCLLVISFIVAIILLFIHIRSRKHVKTEKDDVHNQVFLCCLLFWFSITLLTYIGASFKPETSFSDIRTIAFALLSLLLPFVFMSKKTISFIKSQKILLSCLILLMVVSSIRTAYEIYPKSVYDPIYVAEDFRLGSASVYVLDDFLNAYYKTGGIMGDYKVFNRVGVFLSDSYYEKRLLNDTTLGKPFSRFPNKSILIFNVAGTTYPSIYHSREAYISAYNFSLNNSRIYDNGIVVMVVSPHF